MLTKELKQRVEELEIALRRARKMMHNHTFWLTRDAVQRQQGIALLKTIDELLRSSDSTSDAETIEPTVAK